MVSTTKTDQATSAKHAVVHEAILSLVASEPGRAWRGSDIVDRLDEHRIVDVMVGLAVMFASVGGQLTRLAASGGPEMVATLTEPIARSYVRPDIHDRGVIVLCDPRLCTRAYGKLFLASLPPMPRTRALAEVVAFLREAAHD